MVKAGAKKRRAKSEAEKILAAVNENTVRPKRATRRAGRVRTYNYKAKAVRAAEKAQELERQLRQPHGPSPFERFVESLSDDERPFARKLFQMDCEHGETALAISSSYVEGTKVEVVSCEYCGMVIRWHGSKTATRYAEWTRYCPDGFDMFEWHDLYVKDKAMWRYIFNEVHYMMVHDSMREEG